MSKVKPPPEREIEAFLAFERYGAFAPAADELGISVPALSSLLYRLRKRTGATGRSVRLRKALQDQGWLPTA